MKKIVSNAYDMSDTAKISASVSCINIWCKGIKLARCFFGQNKKFFLLWKEFQSSLLSSLLASSFVSSLQAFQSTDDLKLSFLKEKTWIWRSSVSSTMKKINLITKVLWGPCYNAVSPILKNVYVLFYGLKNVFTYIVSFKFTELCKADIISLL